MKEVKKERGQREGERRGRKERERGEREREIESTQAADVQEQKK